MMIRNAESDDFDAVKESHITRLPGFILIIMRKLWLISYLLIIMIKSSEDIGNGNISGFILTCKYYAS